MSEPPQPQEDEDATVEATGGAASLGSNAEESTSGASVQSQVAVAVEGEGFIPEDLTPQEEQPPDLGGPEEVYSDDDTEVSSEAVVDDIELILMPEEVEDLPSRENSPQLVRVTELHDGGDYGEEEDEDHFYKMDDDGEVYQQGGDEEDQERGGGAEEDYDDDEAVSQQSYSNYYDEDPSISESHPNPASLDRRRRRKSSVGSVASGRLVSSFVQTDISALEDYDDECVSENSDRSDRNWRRRKASGGGGGGGASAVGFRNPGSAAAALAAGGKISARGKRLNWKSELALLPSKTRLSIGASGGGGAAYGIGGAGGGAMRLSMDSSDEPGGGYHGRSGADDDGYSFQSPRVAKFTSQDNVMNNTSSQFLKPSSLYRTKNLSRNLNQFASSETTFMQDQPESPRFKTFTGVGGLPFKASNAAAPGGSSLSARRHQQAPPRPSTAKVNFRQSLPDLTTSDNPFHDSNSRRQIHFRQSLNSNKSGGTMSGRRKPAGGMSRKKSSSDDETSSLIDESERCLRSSIDLLLMDDHASPGFDYPYNPKKSQFHYPASSTSGYYSARRSTSQPIFPEQSYAGAVRDNGMGSPFLPRKLSDMRCTKWAKVILPNGLVAVVNVKETDEVRDMLTIHTDTGCIVTVPFRKVVFAWKLKR